MMPPEEGREQELNRLFRSYREATEYNSDAGPDFMPALWDRIESRRRNSRMVERVARIFTVATATLAVAAGLFVTFAPARPQSDSWVETLANHHLAQNTSYYEPVQLSENTPGK